MATDGPPLPPPPPIPIHNGSTIVYGGLWKGTCNVCVFFEYMVWMHVIVLVKHLSQQLMLVECSCTVAAILFSPWWASIRSQLRGLL